MRVEDFSKETKRQLVAFERWWLEQHEKSPRHFPLNMKAVEWEEQFSAFVDLVFDREGP